MHTNARSMKKIVYDTNSLLRIVPRRSPYHQAWLDVMMLNVAPCFSDQMLYEYEEILSAKTSPLYARHIVNALLQHFYAERITLYYHFHLIESDEDDNKFVDCAITTNADSIVSDDHHFDCLQRIPWPQVHVQTLRDYYANNYQQ